MGHRTSSAWTGCRTVRSSTAYPNTVVRGWRFTANQKKTALALIAFSLLLQALPEILRPTKVSYYEFGWRANLVLWGWIFIFSLVISSIRPSPPGVGERNRRNLILLLCLAFVALVCAHFAIRNRYAAIPDEI